MPIDFATATREEIEVYVKELESKVTKKKVNKVDKLSEELLELFNEYSNNSEDKLLQLYYLLSVVFNDLAIPINEELDKLDYVPDEEDARKVAIKAIKDAGKVLKLRNRNEPEIVENVQEETTTVDSPL